MKNQGKKTKKLPAFYIALCACVLMIGVAGYVTQIHTDETKTVVTTSDSKEKKSKDVFSNELTDDMSLSLAAITPMPQPTTLPLPTKAPEPVTAAAPVDAPVETPISTPAADETAAYTVDNPDTEGGAITVTNDLPVFIMPVNGDILEQYSEKLVFNNALDDWRAHNGIDIAADKGCSVQSASQGVVERVYDDVMGGCVEISHPAGFMTVYRGLEAVENLSEGKELKSGEVIGTTGECRGENVGVPHLHFEMYKDNAAVNPLDYLPH